jgi:hypothetical protein
MNESADQPQPRKPSLLDALIPVIALVVLIALSVYLFGVDATEGPLQVALLLSASVAALIAHKNGYPYLKLSEAAISGITTAMGATTGMATAGWPKRRILGIWLAVAGVSAAAAAGGYALTSLMSLDGVLAQAFAAGALLTMLSDSMLPEAHAEGGNAVGLLTVLGFAVAFALSQLA